MKSSRQKSKSRNSAAKRRPRFENLEQRHLLAISWANETTADFSLYGTSQIIAKELVNRAINDWEAVIRTATFP